LTRRLQRAGATFLFSDAKRAQGELDGAKETIMRNIGTTSATEATTVEPPKKLYMDVHELGKVSAKDVAEAHKKDLEIQAKYGVEFKIYWVDEEHGKVYCLSEAHDKDSVVATHREAHGLLPTWIGEVTEGR
jgi:hypothetical protein